MSSTNNGNTMSAKTIRIGQLRSAMREIRTSDAIGCLPSQHRQPPKKFSPRVHRLRSCNPDTRHDMKTKRELQHDDWIRRCLLPEGSPARGEDITSKLELALRPFADLDLPIEWCQISAEADCIVLDLDYAPQVNEFGDEIEDAQDLFERANAMQDKILRAFRAKGVSCHYVPSGIEFPMSKDENGRRRLNPLSNPQPGDLSVLEANTTDDGHE